MKGKAGPLWPRILAVVCSVTLGAGYVGWRKHRADKAAEQAEKQAEAVKELTMMVGSKSPGRDVILELDDLDLEFLNPGEPLEENPATIDRALMSSSKSMIATDFLDLDELDLNDFGFPDAPPADANTTEPASEARTLMPGSKSISGVFRPRAQSDPEPEPEKEEEKEP